MKSNKGITLVALVITIIVLLILAGVSISLVVGDNGILTQSKGSSDATKIGQMQEALQIAISDVQTSYFGDYANNASTGFDSAVNFGTLAASLNNQGYKLLIKSSKAVASGNTAFPATADITDAVGTFYVSDGKNGIEVKISKSSATSTALKVEYVKTGSGDAAKITLVSAVPAS